MWVRRIWLENFRNYESAELGLDPGLTVVLGANGEGKTNLLEAIGYLAGLSSFRSAPAEAMVRQGCERATVRGEAERGGRDLLVEAEITATGRGRVAVNRQPLRRPGDLLDAVRASVFSPDDLELVKGSPAGRRRYLDDTLVALHPRHDALRRDLERILRQRTSLLRQAAARGVSADVLSTLDVWDAKLAAAGEAAAAARSQLVDQLEPGLAKAYDQLAGSTGLVSGAAGATARYDAPWRSAGLGESLAAARQEELRRGVSLVGPHRDELVLQLHAMAARSHASQGEQRCLALALRLAAHWLVSDVVGEPPVLLLDDVFSELDPGRSRALFEHLTSAAGEADGPTQTVLTTTSAVPGGVSPADVVRVAGGRISGGRQAR